MFSILQAAQETVQQVTLFHVAEASGFIAILGAMWRFSLRITNKLGDVMKYIGVLNAEVKSHVQNTPTLARCAEHTAEVKSVVQASNEKTRDELLAVSLARDGEVSDLEKRVTVAERWQSRHNGMGSGT